jgi:hypothetical protein
MFIRDLLAALRLALLKQAVDPGCDQTFMCWSASSTPDNAGTAPSKFPLKTQLLQFLGGHYLSFD